MEREKEELRKYIESDSKAMKEKLSEEERLRKEKEDEMAARLREQESARENEIIQLYEKMARENAKREAEIEELRGRCVPRKSSPNLVFQHCPTATPRSTGTSARRPSWRRGWGRRRTRCGSGWRGRTPS